MLFAENNNDLLVDLDSIEIDESVSAGYIGALETISWLEEQNGIFTQENAMLDVQEVLSESEEVFNEAAGTWIKERLKKVKDLVKSVFTKIKTFLKKALDKIKGLFKKKDKKSIAYKLEKIPESTSVGAKYVEVTDKGFVSGVLGDAATELITNSNKVISYATRFRHDSKTQLTDKELNELNSTMTSFTKEDAADIGKYFAANGAVNTKTTFNTKDAKEFVADDGSKYIKAIETTIGKLDKTQKDLESSISKLESATEGISDRARVATLINTLSKKMSEGCSKLASLCGSYIKTINKEIATKNKLTNELFRQAPAYKAKEKAAKKSVDESVEDTEADFDDIDDDIELDGEYEE